jgi:hypothetical protein
LKRGERIQDRRAFWRMPTFLSCEVRLGEATHAAFLLEISSRGAMVSSRCTPEKGGSITISLRVPELKKPISLAGNVIRTAQGVSDHGRICRSVVRFDRVSPDSMLLLKTLTSREDAFTRVGAAAKR